MSTISSEEESPSLGRVFHRLAAGGLVIWLRVTTSVASGTNSQCPLWTLAALPDKTGVQVPALIQRLCDLGQVT